MRFFSRIPILLAAALLPLGGVAHGQNESECDRQVRQIEQQLQQQFHPQVHTEIERLLQAAQQSTAEDCLNYVAQAQTLLRNVSAEAPANAEPDPELHPLEHHPQPELEVEQEQPEVKVTPEGEEQHRS